MSLSIRRLRADAMEWRRRVREGWAIMGPIRGLVLLLTQVPVMMLEALVCWLVCRRLEGFPRVLDSQDPSADVIIAVGLDATPYSVYPMGLYLRWRFGYRVLFMQTPPEGNQVPSAEIVELNQYWLAQTVGARPIYGIGFSYGGLDLVWQFSDLLARRSCDIRTIDMVNTPLRGSALARVIHASGARELEPGAAHLQRTQSRISVLREQGVKVNYNTAFLDLVVRKSDSREERPADAWVPNRWQRYVYWPLLYMIGHRRRVPKLPIWWSHTLPHIAHKATLNPILWELFGRRIRANLKNR